MHNQALSVTDQLNAGIRMLQAQTHDFLDNIQMCHTSCALVSFKDSLLHFEMSSILEFLLMLGSLMRELCCLI